jgi:molybdenum cofactor biosynthesis enzyme MoaA
MKLFNKDQLRLLITDSCNLSCTYCHNEGQFGAGHFMPLHEVERLARWLREQNIYVKSLVISGGEPTIHPHLIDIVQALRESADAISMVTNGVKLDRDVIDRLVEAGMKYIKFGIDAVDGLAMTKGPLLRSTRQDAGAKVLANALYAREVMPGSHLNTVVSSYNFDKLRAVVAWCDENRIGAKFLELIEVRPEIIQINPHRGTQNHSWFGSLYSRARDLISSVEYNPRVMKFFARTNSGQVLQFSENFCVFGSCSNLWTRVDSRGQLVPCIHSPATRPLSLDGQSIAQVQGVNEEMKTPHLWPCGNMNLQAAVKANATSVEVLLEDATTVEFPLTLQSNCVC